MLIGLHGKKQAGKDTVYQRLNELIGPGTQTDATVERLSFADLLYRSAAEALGVGVDTLQALKSDPLALVQVRVKHENEALGYWHPEASLTIREYLQRYGTEAHRDVFGDNFWVDQLDLSHEGKIVVVTDVRFRNEAQAVFDAGGTVVHVIGPAGVENAGDGHASEETLPAFLIDHVLYNRERADNFDDLDSRLFELLNRLLREGAAR